MDIVTRLKQLAHAVADEDWSEFSLRVPADSERDADLVLLRASKEIESLRTELAECKRDAELWRAYQARKQAVIDAGMASNPMRAVAANMCPVCHSMVGAPHELWCRHSALAAKGE